MVKLKKLLKESFERKFGQPLATLDSVMNDYQSGKLYTDKDKPPFKTEKQIEEENLNEALKKINQNSRFGAIEIRHGEEPTAPGYDPMYIIDVKIGGNFVAAINIEGDPRDMPYNAKVSVQKFKPKIKIKK
tara:strand:- start:118 stop:510 length:393 start_codon:yes stop_codon:yes gene_type:complete